MKNVVMSVLREEMPLVSARSRFCTTARMRRPIGLTLSAVASVNGLNVEPTMPPASAQLICESR